MPDEKLQHVASALVSVSEITARLKLHSLETQIHSCRELLSESEPGNIAVVGSFKAGKS